MSIEPLAIGVCSWSLQVKNITELKGTPADQLTPAMQFIAASLGVNCEHCHVQGKNDLDDKKEKRIARDMMVGNPRLAEIAFKEESEGRNAIAGGLTQGARWKI